MIVILYKYCIIIGIDYYIYINILVLHYYKYKLFPLIFQIAIFSLILYLYCITCYMLPTISVIYFIKFMLLYYT